MLLGLWWGSSWFSCILVHIVGFFWQPWHIWFLSFLSRTTSTRSTELIKFIFFMAQHSLNIACVVWVFWFIRWVWKVPPAVSNTSKYYVGHHQSLIGSEQEIQISWCSCSFFLSSIGQLFCFHLVTCFYHFYVSTSVS